MGLHVHYRKHSESHFTFFCFLPSDDTQICNHKNDSYTATVAPGACAVPGAAAWFSFLGHSYFVRFWILITRY